MSMPPPPPPGGNGSPFPQGPQGPAVPAGPAQPPYSSPVPPPPPGYQQFGYGMQPVEQKTNGLSVASFVLSLVNVICFVFPLLGVLAIIFGFVARGQINHNPGQRGRGFALAGIIIGLVVVLGAIAFWIYVANSDACFRDGSTYRCDFNR